MKHWCASQGRRPAKSANRKGGGWGVKMVLVHRHLPCICSGGQWWSCLGPRASSWRQQKTTNITLSSVCVCVCVSLHVPAVLAVRAEHPSAAAAVSAASSSEIITTLSSPSSHRALRASCHSSREGRLSAADADAAVDDDETCTTGRTPDTSIETDRRLGLLSYSSSSSVQHWAIRSSESSAVRDEEEGASGCVRFFLKCCCRDFLCDH